MTHGRASLDVVVVGAGIAGLACARALAGAGRTVAVLERSRGVGGRCSTRRVGGQPVDHGAAFIHGADDGFLATAREVTGTEVLEGWPHVVEGRGAPCLSRAFEPFEQRLAYAGGMSSLPKALAQGLDVRRESPLAAFSADADGILVQTEAGAALRTRSIVLAVPPPTALKLLRPVVDDGREAGAVLALLGLIGSQSCLSVLAGYSMDSPRPPWDVCYPESSAVVQMVAHDSAKRPEPHSVVLVIQARPCWSYVNLETPDEIWMATLLSEGARVVGQWAERPLWTQPHRWRYARSDHGSALNRPVSLPVGRGGRVIVTGESFAPGGGLEAAWLAGNASALRLLEEE